MTKHNKDHFGKCPNCGSEFVGAYFIGGKRDGNESSAPPEEGDYSICASCATLMVVGRNGEMLKADLKKLPAVLRLAQAAAAARLKELNEKTRASVKASNQTAIDGLEKQNPMAAVIFLIAFDDNGKMEVAINSEASEKLQRLAAAEFIIGMVQRGLVDATIVDADLFQTASDSKPN